GLTAAAWQYIGRQGVLQGTYELLRTVAAHHFGGAEAAARAGRWMLTAGMGGMGSSQPISAALLGLNTLTVEVDPGKIERLHAAGALTHVASDLDEALAILGAENPGTRPSEATIAVGLHGNAAEVFPMVAERGVSPDI